VSKLVSPKGEILIPGIKELIAPVTDEEREKFEAIHFGVKDIHAAVGGDQTLTNDKVTTLMGRMRNPSLSLHGIEGALCKFSIPLFCTKDLPVIPRWTIC
jgi:Cys-Gly metallodipeptidase DUG1